MNQASSSDTKAKRSKKEWTKTKEKGSKLQAQKTTTTTPSQNVGEECKEKKRGEGINFLHSCYSSSSSKGRKAGQTTKTALLHCSTVKERARIPIPGSSAAGIENVIWNVIKQRNGRWKHGEFSAPTSTARHSSSQAGVLVGNMYFIRSCRCVKRK